MTLLTDLRIRTYRGTEEDVEAIVALAHEHGGEVAEHALHQPDVAVYQRQVLRDHGLEAQALLDHLHLLPGEPEDLRHARIDDLRGRHDLPEAALHPSSRAHRPRRRAAEKPLPEWPCETPGKWRPVCRCE